jgi:hypothetical protein
VTEKTGIGFLDSCGNVIQVGHVILDQWVVMSWEEAIDCVPALTVSATVSSLTSFVVVTQQTRQEHFTNLYTQPYTPPFLAYCRLQHMLRALNTFRRMTSTAAPLYRKQQLKIACVQYDPQLKDVQGNITRVKSFLRGYVHHRWSWAIVGAKGILDGIILG